MVFFFEKGAVELQLETHLDPVTGVYTVIRRRSDGEVVSDDIQGEEPCRLMLREIETNLEQTGWRRSHPPQMLD
jgi:hypothetical protein